MVVKGFGVSRQTRKTLRSPLNGSYGGYRWEIECVDKGVFRWTIFADKVMDKKKLIGGLTPYGSELAIALSEIKTAVKALAEMAKYGLLREEKLKIMTMLFRWRRLTILDRLEMKVKRSKRDRRSYYVIKEK